MFEKLKAKILLKKKKQAEIKNQLWEEERPLIEQKNRIKQERKELRKKYKKLSYSKFLLIFLFINFTLLELFIAWVTIYCFSFGGQPDFTPLVTLIGAVAGETISYWIYAAKSKAENTEGGIVYQSMMNSFNNDEEENDG